MRVEMAATAVLASGEAEAGSTSAMLSLVGTCFTGTGLAGTAAGVAADGVDDAGLVADGGEPFIRPQAPSAKGSRIAERQR